MRIEDLISAQDMRDMMLRMAGDKPKTPEFSEEFLGEFRQASMAIAIATGQDPAGIYATMMTAVSIIDETLKFKMETILT